MDARSEFKSEYLLTGWPKGRDADLLVCSAINESSSAFLPHTWLVFRWWPSDFSISFTEQGDSAKFGLLGVFWEGLFKVSSAEEELWRALLLFKAFSPFFFRIPLAFLFLPPFLLVDDNEDSEDLHSWLFSDEEFSSLRPFMGDS